jgi:transmembrane sensor
LPRAVFALRSATENTEMSSPANTIKNAAADWTARRDAGLSRAESAQLQAWLDADPRHREALADCDSAWGALDRPYQTGVADDLLQAVEARVRRRRKNQITSAVAGLTVLLVAGSGWRTAVSSAGDPSVERRPSGGANVIVPARNNFPDGSIVELNAGAEIKTDFSAQLRRVVLRKGEAHFQVSKDSSRPFVVVVGDVEVRVVGTAFAVRRGAAKVEVVVTSGEVALDKHGEISAARGAVVEAAAPQTIATLAPGYRAVVSFAAADRTPPQVDILAAGDLQERLAWRAPQLEFSGTPLSEAVALLNEQADKAVAVGQPARRYAIGDPEISAVRVSGLFRVDNSDSFVRLLKHGFGIEAEQRENSAEVVLRKAR